jgi:hypothetical protein
MSRGAWYARKPTAWFGTVVADFTTGAQEVCESWRFVDNGYRRFDTVLETEGAGRNIVSFLPDRIGLPRYPESCTVCPKGSEALIP